MNLVDSSAWLEYLAGGPNAGYFSSAIEKTAELLVPTICQLEVFKVIRRQHPQKVAADRVAHMRLGQVIPLTEELALEAAQLGLAHRLPLADSIILATARAYEAAIWTQDAHFQGLAGVKYRAKVET